MAAAAAVAEPETGQMHLGYILTPFLGAPASVGTDYDGPGVTACPALGELSKFWEPPLAH